MKKINLGYFFLIGIASLFIHACISDQKALQIVLTKKPLFDTVGQVYTQLHPCNPISISHKSDTSYLHDTSIVYKVDTVGNYIHDTTTKTIRLYTKIHDRDTIVDGQQITILKSQLEQKQLDIAVLNTTIFDNQVADNKKIKELQHAKDIADWELWGLLILIGLGVLWKVYSWVNGGTVKNVGDELISKI
jgi:hypothetical protein